MVNTINFHHGFVRWSVTSETPLSEPRIQRTGRLDIIDLANVHSCSFVATQDLAEWTDEGLENSWKKDRSFRGSRAASWPPHNS